MIVVGAYNSFTHQWTYTLEGTKENPHKFDWETFKAHKKPEIKLPPNTYRFIVSLHIFDNSVEYRCCKHALVVSGKAW